MGKMEVELSKETNTSKSITHALTADLSATESSVPSTRVYFQIQDDVTWNRIERFLRNKSSTGEGWTGRDCLRVAFLLVK
jgi:hypothetical protein